MQEFIENIKLNETEIEEKRTILKSKPHRLMILLTTKCNLECIMCHRVRVRKQTVPFDAIKKIYDLLPYVTWINWQGGEVFLVDYFKQLFLKIRNYRHIYQTILTNGLLIDDEWAKILAESNTGVTYSIDAVTKQTYEKIRRGARFDDLLKSCGRISKYREKYNSSTPLEITAVVMRSNYRELYLFPEFCKKNGFTNLRFDYLHPEIVPEEDVILKRSPDAVEYMRNVIPEIEMKCKELNIGFDCTFRGFLDDERKQSSSPNPDRMLTKHKERSEINNKNYSGVLQGNIKCKLPWQQFTIVASEKGDVQPDCACIYPVGNLMESKIDEIWNSEKMQLYRHNLITGNVKNWCAKKCLIGMGYGWNG